MWFTQIEILSIHIGQAGVQLGNTCWELYCLEHGLNETGEIISKPDATNLNQLEQFGLEGSNFIAEGFHSFFNESSTGCFVPRAIFVDLEPTVIDGTRSGSFKKLYHPEYLLSGEEDAANNFARGYYSTGTKMIDRLMTAVYDASENCEYLQGFMIFHSCGGGTGSGFHSLLIHEISQQFPKTAKLELALAPSRALSTAVVEPYNTVLVTDGTLDCSDCVFLADNKSLYDICHKKLDVDIPLYDNLNRLLAQTVSSLTTSIRFKGSLNADFIDFQTNLVPYPRIHFPIMSYAPLTCDTKSGFDSQTVLDITSTCFDNSSRMLQCENETGKYMSCCLLYRGDVTPKDVNAAISFIKNKKNINFVSWSPTGFKIGINDSPPVHVLKGDLAKASRAACMLCNTTAVKETWSNLNVKYNVMLAKRAFLHWFLAEGMEEGQFFDAQDNVLVLEEEYNLMVESE